MKKVILLFVLIALMVGVPITQAALLNPGFDIPPGGGAGVAPGWASYEILPGLPLPPPHANYFFGSIVPNPISLPSVQEWWGAPPQTPFWGGIFQQDQGPFQNIPYIASISFEDPLGFGPTQIRLGVDPIGGTVAAPWGPIPNPTTIIWSPCTIYINPMCPGTPSFNIECCSRDRGRNYKVNCVPICSNCKPCFVPIPAPSTLLLLGSGLIGVIGLGRRRIFKKVSGE
jgi:hypothetical protein